MTTLMHTIEMQVSRELLSLVLGDSRFLSLMETLFRESQVNVLGRTPSSVAGSRLGQDWKGLLLS